MEGPDALRPVQPLYIYELPDERQEAGSSGRGFYVTFTKTMVQLSGS